MRLLPDQEALVVASVADADADAETEEFIQLACKNGNAEVVRLLLADPRVDPTVSNEFAIRKAGQSDNADVVRLLLADSKS